VRRIGALLVPPWAGRNLRVVLAARLAMSVGRAVASIVTALYLAAIGFSAVEIGALFVGVTVASALMSSAIGLLADRWSRRPFLVGVPLLTAVAAVVYSGSRSATVLFVAAAFGSFGRGAGAGAGNVGPYQPAESALVAESVTAHQRAAAFGRLAFASSLGALIGGVLVQVVRTSRHMTPAQAMAAYRPAFLLVAGLAAAAGLLALLIDEPVRPARPGVPRGRWRWPSRSWPALWRFWVTNATNGAAIGLFGPFVSYWLYRRYGASPAQVGVLFAVVNLASLASTLVAARIARQLGTVRAITVVRALGGALLAPMVLAPSFWAAGAVYVVRMMLQRVGLPLRQSFTQDMAHPAERASVAALSNLPAQATMAGGQALAGYLFDEVSLALPFELAAALQVANAGLYSLLFSWRPPRPRPQVTASGAEPGWAATPAASPAASPAATRVAGRP
jgi:MFS family permease